MIQHTVSPAATGQSDELLASAHPLEFRQQLLIRASEFPQNVRLRRLISVTPSPSRSSVWLPPRFWAWSILRPHGLSYNDYRHPARREVPTRIIRRTISGY
jgi:hypothetical protein